MRQVEAAQQEKTIDALMAEGLDRYGLGEVERAVECWRAVLDLDPDHAEAQDFLRSAGFDPAAPLPAAEGDGDAALLRETVALCRKGHLSDALDRLEELAAEHPDHLGVQAWIDLVRSRLFAAYRKRIGSGSGVPRVVMPAERIRQFQLPVSAGFVLAMVDGRTSIDQILALSGMDPFQALHALASLLGGAVIEIAQ